MRSKVFILGVIPQYSETKKYRPFSFKYFYKDGTPHRPRVFDKNKFVESDYDKPEWSYE